MTETSQIKKINQVIFYHETLYPKNAIFQASAWAENYKMHPVWVRVCAPLRRILPVRLGLIFMGLARKKRRVFYWWLGGPRLPDSSGQKALDALALLDRPSTTLKSWQSETLLPACLTQGTYRAGITLFLGCVYINLEKKIFKIEEDIRTKFSDYI